MKEFVFITIYTLITLVAHSQSADKKQFNKQQKNRQKQERINKLIKQEEEGAIIFRRHTVFGVKLNTDGYGTFLELGRQKSASLSNLYSLELGERHHPKEERVFPTAPSTLANYYIYGKINNFYYTKLGFAQQRLIGGKGSKHGVAIFAIYGGGISAGLLKPYYLKIAFPRYTDDVKYNNNDDVFLRNTDLIHGATGFQKGFDEIKVTPGIFAKTALRFDYGRFNRLLSALEVGFNVEAYSKPMQQMLIVKSNRLFYNLYAAIEFGKRK